MPEAVSPREVPKALLELMMPVVANPASLTCACAIGAGSEAFQPPEEHVRKASGGREHASRGGRPGGRRARGWLQRSVATGTGTRLPANTLRRRMS